MQGFLLLRYTEKLRVRPDIIDMESHVSFDGLLRNSPSVLYQNKHRLWQTFHREDLVECNFRHSIFVLVDSVHLFRLKKHKNFIKRMRQKSL